MSVLRERPVSELRKQLEQARADYESQRFPGDLASLVAERVEPNERNRRGKWAVVGIVAAIAALLLIAMRLPAPSPMPKPGPPIAAADDPAAAPPTSTKAKTVAPPKPTTTKKRATLLTSLQRNVLFVSAKPRQAAPKPVSEASVGFDLLSGLNWSPKLLPPAPKKRKKTTPPVPKTIAPKAPAPPSAPPKAIAVTKSPTKPVAIKPYRTPTLSRSSAGNLLSLRSRRYGV